MGLQQAYSALRYEFNESLDLQSSFLGDPNIIDVIKQKTKDLISQQEKKIQEAHKAVYDKNKQISDLFNKNTEL